MKPILAAAVALAALACTRGADPEAPTAEAPATEPAKAPGAAEATGGAAGGPTTKSATARPATPKATPPAGQGTDAPLPPSDRVFVAPLADGVDHLIGADADHLWAVRPTAPGRGVLLWRVQGPGVAHRVAWGDLGDGPKLFVAWGVGRGFLQAPLVIDALDPKTGARTELWREAGERNEAAHLQVADVDRDGAPELAFARYASKYMVEPRPIEKDGTATPGAPIRMASSWLYADLDGEPGPEAVIGRVYGDARGLPGDLRIRTAAGEIPVPTDRGVKTLMYGAPGGEPPALFVVDGWEADYGKKATARVKRVRLVDGAPQVETIGQSPDEFTFFALTEVDLDGDGVTEIAAQGNKRVTHFARVDGQWITRPLADLEPVINTAIGEGPDGYTLYVPARPVTRATPLRAR